MDEREVVSAFPFVTDEQGSETIVPTVGSLDDPPSRLAANAPDERLLTAAPDVRDDVPDANLPFGVRVVEALVQAKILGPPRPAWRAKHDGVEGRSRHPLVVDVRAGDLDGDRDAPRLGQDVAFCAEFRAIGRVGTGVVPPFGAFTLALSSEHHLRSTPTRSS